MTQVDFRFPGRSRAAVLALCSILPAVVSASAPGAAAVLRPEVVPAAGRQTAELEVADFGRYAIAVTSSQGTALQVVDRMSGAGEVAGEAGKSDGRIDLFLDRGEVRVVTFGSKLGTGEARLTVTPFRERGGADSELRAQLVEGKPVDGELADFEQLSWWLDLGARRRVVFEAAGRNLADLRLWQNGSWLVDATPVVSRIEPQAGRPLALCQLTADLSPGLYRLTAYGGPEVPWARGASERPFHLRYGMPRDAQTLRERRKIGPFGFDRVLVPGVADFYRLELPEAVAGDETVGLELATLDESDPFAGGGPSAYLTKENVPPVAELSTAAEPERLIAVTVRGTEGQAYVLQHFARTRERELSPRTTKSAYWVSTVHAGPLGDAIDPTAILVRAGTGKPGANRLSEVLAGETVVLSRASGWAQRFNLLEPATVFVQVREAGSYVLQSRGAAAEFRLEPLFLDGAPQGYEVPPARTAPTEWQLDPGYYRLALAPVQGGIAEVELVAKGAPPVALQAPRPSVQLGVVTLNSKLAYHLYISNQPGVESGLVVRELPLDLAAALPLALGAGEEIELPLRAGERSRVRALTEDGGGLEVSVDGGPWQGNAADSGSIEKGEHRLRVRSTSDRTVLASVGLASEAQLATTPLPEIPAATLAALPEFPRLEASSAQTFDLATDEARTFLLAADAPALYRIESTGLLATAGALRTRTRANLLSQAENGIGRNFALAAYLREGDYQLTVRPRGASAGHLGLELARAPIAAGGKLALGIPARAELDAQRALAFDLTLAEPGRVHLGAWGLRKEFAFRLEDSDGWPVAEPVANGELAVDLAAGSYRLIVLPQAVAARAVVLATVEKPLAELTGHGPHRLSLDLEATKLWLEPEPGAPRLPDRWRFTLPAPTVVTLTLSDEMQGELRAIAGGADAPVLGLVPPGRTLRLDLAAGDYELAATSSRENNRQSYRVSVRAEELVDGGRRELAAPGEVRLSIGSDAQVELASFGRSDVRATLLTEFGAVIATADDRPGDWNFLLSQRLASGHYRLRVDPVGQASATTQLTLRVLSERVEPAFAATPGGARAAFEVAEEAVIVPLARPAGAEILAVGAQAAESLGLALEERLTAEPAAGRWREVAATSGRGVTLALPLAETTGDLRLRIWSLDRRPAAVELSAFAGALAHHREAELARGFALARLPGVVPAFAAAVVDLDEPGCFRREAGGESGPVLLQALAAGSALEAAAPTLAAVGLALPLAAALDDFPQGDGLEVRARRARVGDGEALALSLPARTPITCDVADGGAAIVELTASGGEPMVGFLDGSGQVGPSTAVSLASSGRVLTARSAGKGRAVELWNAGEDAVEAELSGWIARTAATRETSWGTLSEPVPARGATVVGLPVGRKEIRLTLSTGMAALALSPAPVANDGLDAEGLVWAPVDATTETLLTSTTKLLLLGGESAPGLASIELLPRTDAEPAENGFLLTDRDRFEKKFPFTGVFRLPVKGNVSGKRLLLHVRGDIGTSGAVFVGADGGVERGRDLALSSAGGSLRIDHGPGLVSAWIDEEERTQGVGPNVLTDHAASWGIDPSTAARAVALPAAIDLAGATLAFEVEVAAPSLLKLRGTTPLAVAALPGAATAAERFEVFPDGASFDAVIPAGKSRVVLRGLAGEALSGSATLVAEPLLPLAEGLGPETLLAAGDSRGFLFHVAKPGAVGLGVRADLGGVDTALYNGAGAWIGRGVVQWFTLAPDDYVLVVTAPPEGRPALVRPALVGSTPPGGGPPPEEARRFLVLAAGEAPVVHGVAGAENRPVDWLADENDPSADDGPRYVSDDGDDNGEDESYDSSESDDSGETSDEDDASDEGE